MSPLTLEERVQALEKAVAAMQPGIKVSGPSPYSRWWENLAWASRACSTNSPIPTAWTGRWFWKRAALHDCARATLEAYEAGPWGRSVRIAVDVDPVDVL